MEYNKNVRERTRQQDRASRKVVFQMKIRAISASVYRNDLYRGCSNGGISERYDRMFVVCEDGNHEFDSDNLPENIVVIENRGKYSRCARPLASVSEGCVGWMSGGALLYSSDSRFPGGEPVRIHDRQESYELYNSMFN